MRSRKGQMWSEAVSGPQEPGNNAEIGRRVHPGLKDLASAFAWWEPVSSPMKWVLPGKVNGMKPAERLATHLPNCCYCHPSGYRGSTRHTCRPWPRVPGHRPWRPATAGAAAAATRPPHSWCEPSVVKPAINPDRGVQALPRAAPAHPDPGHAPPSAPPRLRAEVTSLARSFRQLPWRPLERPLVRSSRRAGVEEVGEAPGQVRGSEVGPDPVRTFLKPQIAGGLTPGTYSRAFRFLSSFHCWRWNPRCR